MPRKQDMTRRSYVKMGSGIIGLAGLAGCSGDGGTTTDDGSTSTDGGGSGEGTTTGSTDTMADEVVYYGSADRPGLFSAFEEKTGITVNSVTAPGYESVARFQNEEEQGQHSADVLHTITDQFMLEDVHSLLAEISLWDDFRDSYSDRVIEQMEDAASDEVLSKMLPVTQNYFGQAYSTDRLDSVETLEDLIQPDTEDNIVAPTFTFASSYWILRQEWSESEVDEYLTSLEDHGMQYVGGATSAMTESIVAGQANVAFGVIADTAIGPLLLNDAPIAPVPQDWTGTTVTPMGVSANAPHPEAAKELIRFAMSEEGQRANANYESGRGALHKDVSHGNEHMQEWLSDMDIYPMIITPERREELNSKVGELLNI